MGVERSHIVDVVIGNNTICDVIDYLPGRRYIPYNIKANVAVIVIKVELCHQKWKPTRHSFIVLYCFSSDSNIIFNTGEKGKLRFTI